MGVQKSRKSVKYTKYSLKRDIKKRNNLYVYILRVIKASTKKKYIFSIINKKNTQNLFF